MSLFKKKAAVRGWDREKMKPVLHCSICTGEQTAGFRHLDSGRLEEVVCIRSKADLEKFKAEYGISDEEITKEW